MGGVLPFTHNDIQVPKEARRMHRSLGAGVTGGWELPNVGAKN